MKWLQQLAERLTRRGRRPSAPRTPARRARLRLEELESRIVPYALSGDAWPGPQLITISFVPDGTQLTSNASGPVYSNLFSAFNSKFGSAAAWQDQILKAAQAWAQQTNVNFAVVSDDGVTSGNGPDQQGDPNMGDIRIGGFNFGNSNLASAFMPPPANNYSIAGDINFNTAQAFNIGKTYDLFTVAMHEFGHALGLYHSTVVSAAMYGSYSGMKPGLSSDDIAGIRATYGGARSPDSYGGTNNSFAGAADLSSQFGSSSLTAVVNNLDVSTAGQAEYFTFTAPSGTSGSLTVNVQSQGLSLLAPTLTVYAADQQTILGSAGGAGQYGATLSTTLTGVTAGQRFYVKVAGADNSAFGTGNYALTLNFGPGPNPAVTPPNTTDADGTPVHGGGGEPDAQSQQFLVSPATTQPQQTFYQSPRAVGMDGSGNYVVTWAGYGQDGSGWGVFAQRYAADGTPLGGEFRVNTYTGGNQMYPSIAMNASGNFVITWSSQNQDGSGWGVYAQRFNSLGQRVGGEFRVNSYTAGDQMYSSAAMDSLGDIVITWSSYGQDGSGWGVYAKRYNVGLLGLLSGGEFRVNDTTAGDQTYSSVSMDAVGDFVVTWASNGQDGSGWGVYGKLYTTLVGLPLLEFRVNDTTVGDQTYPSVAMNSLGNFVITWSGNGQDGDGWGVYAKRYLLDLLPLGGEFYVNTTTAGDQMYSSVAMDGAGNFLITWSSSNPGNTANPWDIAAQQFNSGGYRVGDEFAVNTNLVGSQEYSSAAIDGNAQAVVVWSGVGPAGVNAVFGQRYSLNGSGPVGEAVADEYGPAPDWTAGGDSAGPAAAPAPTQQAAPPQTAAAPPSAGATVAHGAAPAAPAGTTTPAPADPTPLQAAGALTGTGAAVTGTYASPSLTAGVGAAGPSFVVYGLAAPGGSGPVRFGASPAEQGAGAADAGDRESPPEFLPPPALPDSLFAPLVPLAAPAESSDACFADTGWMAGEAGPVEAGEPDLLGREPDATALMAAVAVGLLTGSGGRGDERRPAGLRQSRPG